METLRDEAKPILTEINTTMSTVNNVVASFDKSVGGVSKFFGGFTMAGLLAFSKARMFSQSVLKKGLLWALSLFKLMKKK